MINNDKYKSIELIKEDICNIKDIFFSNINTIKFKEYRKLVESNNDLLKLKESVTWYKKKAKNIKNFSSKAVVYYLKKANECQQLYNNHPLVINMNNYRNKVIDILKLIDSYLTL